MKKYEKDGNVAVLYSIGYGSGWYSWHYVEELLYDPIIVNMILESGETVVFSSNLIEEIKDYCLKTYDFHNYYGIAGLTVGWVKKGDEFLISEYDGAETISLKSKFKFLKA